MKYYKATYVNYNGLPVSLALRCKNLVEAEALVRKFEFKGEPQNLEFEDITMAEFLAFDTDSYFSPNVKF